jgi:hypothetical protein
MKIEEQIVQYKKNLDAFLKDISDGTFDEDINYIKQNYDNLNNQQKTEINAQINSFVPEKEASPNSPQRTSPTRQGIIKQISNSISGALGLPRSLSDAKDIFRRNIQTEIRNKITNPGVAVNRILQRNRERRGGTPSKIQPENFYTRQNKSVEDYVGEDNGRKHLVVFHILIFRMANFTGFTDSLTVNKNTLNYFGRPEPFYLYTGVTRNVSFNFDVVVNDVNDVNNIYSRLNTLTSLAYPFSYTDTNMIEPTILKLSIGEYFYKQPFFLSSITYTASDEVVFYGSKPSIISVSVQGDIIQSKETPTYEKSERTPQYVNNKVSQTAPQQRSSIERRSLPETSPSLDELANNNIVGV